MTGLNSTRDQPTPPCFNRTGFVGDWLLCQAAVIAAGRLAPAVHVTLGMEDLVSAMFGTEVSVELM